MKNIFKSIRPFIIKYEPEILMAMGISGMIFSTVWGIKATIKAKDIIDQEKREQIYAAEQINTPVYKLTKKDIIKLTWKLYIPVVISIGISIPCIITGNRVSNKRNTALAAAYVISETALQEFQDKTLEIVGPKEEQKIHEAISNDTVKKTYANSNVILTGDGDSLFYEPLSGRYFKSNWNKILRAANELNAKAIGDVAGNISLTEWFYEIGLDHTAISDDIGWMISDGTSGLISVEINSVLTPDNTPCGSIYYRTRPKTLL